MKVKKLSGVFVVGAGLALASGVAEAAPEWAKKGETLEKCLGVSVKGKNDCGSKNGTHTCGGMAKTDRSPDEWVYTPKGLCDKLGGKVWKTKVVK